MNIVDTVARKIDFKAFRQNQHLDSLEVKRRALAQSTATVKAVAVLKIALLERPSSALDIARELAPHLYGGIWRYSNPHDQAEFDRERDRAKTESLAAEIYRLALKTRNLRQQLIDYELEGWRTLNVPVDLPELRAIVVAKYACNI